MQVLWQAGHLSQVRVAPEQVPQLDECLCNDVVVPTLQEHQQPLDQAVDVRHLKHHKKKFAVSASIPLRLNHQ